MTSVMLKNSIGTNFLSELQTKVKFDTLNGTEIKKPEPASSGIINPSKSGETDTLGESLPPIVSEHPDLRKHVGVLMSKDDYVERFIKIPRELFEDPNWKGLRLKYQRLYLIILENVAYRARIYKHNGNTIPVAPGQFCVSFRRLAEIFNQDVKWKDERIDAPLVQRAVSVFAKFGFSIHESIHGIMRITITQRELCEHFKRQTDTPSDTQPIQNRYTNEERKERKDIKETIDRADALDSSLLYKEKEEDKKQPSVFKPQSKPKDISPEKQKEFDILWAFIVKNSMSDGHTPNKKKGIIEKDVLAWMSKYDAKTIFECLKLTLKCVPKSSWPGYMTTILSKNVVAKKDNIQINDEFLNEIMKTHKCLHLENTKQYVTDKIKHVDYQKNTSPDQFKDMILRSLEMAGNYEYREQNQREEEYEDDY